MPRLSCCASTRRSQLLFRAGSRGSHATATDPRTGLPWGPVHGVRGAGVDMTRSAGQARGRVATNDDLLFCSNCHVSIAAAEVESGFVRRAPTNGVLCTLCARADKDGRQRRRAVLEQEFADNAPIARPSARAPTTERAAAATYGPTVESRVGHLERTVFQLQARVEELEARLAAEDAARVSR